MSTSITYGATTCLLDSTEAIHLRPAPVDAIAVEQVAAQVVAQLAEPIDYPALAQATIPGDRVAVVLGTGIPQRLAIVDGVMQALSAAGVEQELVTVLLNGTDESAERLREGLATRGHDRCHVKLHDSGNDDEIAYLGATRQGDALRLNREMCEADFVLPIGVATLQPSASENSLSSNGWFPEFCDNETNKRLVNLAAEDFSTDGSDFAAEAEECIRQLGVGLALQIVPAPAGQVAAVFAGDPRSTARRAQAEAERIWNAEADLRGKLVIATITGDQEQQTWQNVARAIAAAESILDPDGAVVVCSEIDEMPGLAISQLAGGDDPMVVEREILRNAGPDSLAALQLCRALQNYSVYLRSNLRPAIVESLGITPIEDDGELDRLAQAQRPCVVLEEAQRLVPCLVESKV